MFLKYEPVAVQGIIENCQILFEYRSVVLSPSFSTLVYLLSLTCFDDWNKSLLRKMNFCSMLSSRCLFLTDWVSFYSGRLKSQEGDGLNSTFTGIQSGKLFFEMQWIFH